MENLGKTNSRYRTVPFFPKAMSFHSRITSFLFELQNCQYTIIIGIKPRLDPSTQAGRSEAHIILAVMTVITSSF